MLFDVFTLTSRSKKHEFFLKFSNIQVGLNVKLFYGGYAVSIPKQSFVIESTHVYRVSNIVYLEELLTIIIYNNDIFHYDIIRILLKNSLFLYIISNNKNNN